MGSEAIALPMLEDLLSHFGEKVCLAGVFTGADKPSGRGLKLTANPIKKWAVAKSLPLRQSGKIRPS